MIKITGPFLIIFLTACFLFFAATNIQGGWLYLVDAFLWSGVLMAFFIPLLQMRKLKFERLLPSICYAEEEISVTIKVTNEGRLATSFLSIKDLVAERFLHPELEIDWPDASGFLISLSPKESFSFTYKVRFPTRGSYLFSELSIGSFGPLGLVGVYKKHRCFSQVTVKPILPQKSTLVSQAVSQAQKTPKNPKLSDNTLNISHFRDYQSGDHQRFIHWKNSAKNSRLIVTEHRNDPQRKIGIWVDTSLFQPHLEKTIEEVGQLIYPLLTQELSLYVFAQAPQKSIWTEKKLTAPLRVTQHLSNWKKTSLWLATLEADSEQTLIEALKKASFTDIDALFVFSGNPDNQMLLKQRQAELSHQIGIELLI